LQFFIAAAISHYAVLSGERYRREIARRILALQVAHRELLGYVAQREAASAASDRVHRKLAESEAKLRKIFETSSDLIAINRRSDGHYLEVNEAFVATGYSRAEALDETSGALGVWSDQAQLSRFLHQISTEGSVANFEMDLRTKPGAVRPYLISAMIAEVGGEPCVVSISRDITAIKETQRDLLAARELMSAQIKTLEHSEERLLAEILERTRAMDQREAALRELAESEGKLRKIFDASPDSISITRLSDGRIMAVNESMCAMTGLKAEEMIGHSAGATSIWKDNAPLNEILQRLQIDGRVRDVKADLWHRSGLMIPHTISAVVAELGGELCAIAVAHDISEQKRTETELLAAREAMSVQIDTLERTEERLRAEILERTRAMEEREKALRELADSEGKLRKFSMSARIRSQLRGWLMA
jgi:PAS domain S-box-containing protein